MSRHALALPWRLPEAIGHLEQATALAPALAAAHAHLGIAQRAVEYDPNNKSVYYLLGQALQKLGRESDAAKQFEIAICLSDSAQPR